MSLEEVLLFHFALKLKKLTIRIKNKSKFKSMFQELSCAKYSFLASTITYNLINKINSIVKVSFMMPTKKSS